MADPTPDTRATLELLERVRDSMLNRKWSEYAFSRTTIDAIIRDLRLLELAAEIESDLMLRIKRLEADRDAGWAAADALAGALDDAIEVAKEGWSYAAHYFREKWDCDGQIGKLHEALAAYTAARAKRTT